MICVQVGKTWANPTPIPLFSVFAFHVQRFQMQQTAAYNTERQQQQQQLVAPLSSFSRATAGPKGRQDGELC
jgi:hypothetical protein